MDWIEETFHYCVKIQLLFNNSEETPFMAYDFLGALISLLSTYYFIRLDVKAWPIGLVATCFNSWLYWQNGIYADMCLESIYFVSICFGWYRWSKQRHQKASSVKNLSNKQWLILCLAILALYTLIYNLLTSLSHSTIPIVDAITTALSLVAQCLMCYKILATWILWFIADTLFALMYWHKNLPFHTLLMIVYTGMAVLGYQRWLKERATRRQPSNQKSNEPMV